jgi:hypothetical protein
MGQFTDVNAAPADFVPDIRVIFPSASAAARDGCIHSSQLIHGLSKVAEYRGAPFVLTPIGAF